MAIHAERLHLESGIVGFVRFVVACDRSHHEDAFLTDQKLRENMMEGEIQVDNV
jgi:hypothetical protein